MKQHGDAHPLVTAFGERVAERFWPVWDLYLVGHDLGMEFWYDDPSHVFGMTLRRWSSWIQDYVAIMFAWRIEMLEDGDWGIHLRMLEDQLEAEFARAEDLAACALPVKVPVVDWDSGGVAEMCGYPFVRRV